MSTNALSLVRCWRGFSGFHWEALCNKLGGFLNVIKILRGEIQVSLKEQERWREVNGKITMTLVASATIYEIMILRGSYLKRAGITEWDELEKFSTPRSFDSDGIHRRITPQELHAMELPFVAIYVDKNRTLDLPAIRLLGADGWQDCWLRDVLKDVLKITTNKVDLPDSVGIAFITNAYPAASESTN